MPDTESVQMKVTVTEVVFHPPAFGAGDAVAVIVGKELSIFTVTIALDESPATSVTVPVT